MTNATRKYLPFSYKCLFLPIDKTRALVYNICRFVCADPSGVSVSNGTAKDRKESLRWKEKKE